MDPKTIELIKTLTTAVIAIILLLAMTWIVLSPNVSDELSKAALVIIGSAVGFIFGRESAR